MTFLKPGTRLCRLFAATLLLGSGAAASMGATPSAAPLETEHLTTETLGNPSPHWAFVVDYAFSNEIDTRVIVFDGDAHRVLGQVGTGFLPGVMLSPDNKSTVVATTYFSRGGRGARSDVVEFSDNRNLTVTDEILLPSKRMQAIPTLFNLGYSTDGRFLYVAYLTPASSFGVLDPAGKRVLGEVNTAGCSLVIPSGARRVSSLCESGRLLTVKLDEQGRESSRALSEPFFDPGKDPVFVQGIAAGSNAFTFISFLGDVHPVDLSGEQPLFAPSWSLVSAAERGKWRPGGNQPAALHAKLRRLYVPMHVGRDGSHKDGGSEIWVFDYVTHRRLARWPIPTKGVGNAVAVQVSQDDQPLLFAATDRSSLLVLDALTGSLRHTEKQLGQTPWQIINPAVAVENK